MKNFWNRFASSLRVPPEGRCGDPRLLAALTRVSDRLRSDPRPPC